LGSDIAQKTISISMSTEYKMHWISEKALSFDPDRMKISFSLEKDGVKREGIGEVMLTRNSTKKMVAVEIFHNASVSDIELRTTKYSLTPALIAKIKRAKTTSGDDVLWLEA